MPDPQLLIRFACIAEHLSFSGAAAVLGIDQATLSRQIRRLEQYLGFALFARSTRSVALTDRGADLLPAARDVAAAHARAGRAISALRREDSGVLRVGTNPYVYWSPQMRTLLKEFRDRAVTVRVQTVSGTSGRQIARLRAGELEVALIVDAGLPDDIETLAVMSVKPNLLLPRTHRLAKRPLLELRDLAGLQVAIASPGRDKADFDRLYRPFFASGAQGIPVTEGAAAVVYFAATDNLAMISLRSMDTPPHAGFVRREVVDAPLVGFMLARVAAVRARDLAHRFWQLAARVVNGQAAVPPSASTGRDSHAPIRKPHRSRRRSGSAPR
jgi:DNA-binding transcriptional LysR family regulator